jgi:hypothetical protein
MSGSARAGSYRTAARGRYLISGSPGPSEASGFVHSATCNYSFGCSLVPTSTGTAAVLASSSLDQPPPNALINCTFALS